MPARSTRNTRLFFAVLTLLAAAALGGNWWYNVSQQLTPAKLAAAGDRWKAANVADYDLMVRRETVSAADSDDITRDEWRIEVRGGTVTAATLNGKPVPAADAANYSVPGWFATFGRQLADDLAANRRVFCRGRFDAADGHPVHYVRRVSRTTDRQEVAFKLLRP